MERPTEFKTERADCTVRALSLAANVTYEDAHNAWKSVGRKDRCGINIENKVTLACKVLGFTAKQVRRHGTIKKFLRLFPKGNFFCVKNDHAFAVIDGVPHDLESTGSYLEGAWLISKTI